MIIGDPDRCPISLSDGCKTCSKIYSDEDRIEYGNCHEDDLKFNKTFINFSFKDQLSSHCKKTSTEEVNLQLYEAYEEKNMYKMRVALKHYLANKEKYLIKYKMSEEEFYEKYNRTIRDNNLCLNII